MDINQLDFQLLFVVFRAVSKSLVPLGQWVAFLNQNLQAAEFHSCTSTWFQSGQVVLSSVTYFIYGVGIVWNCLLTSRKEYRLPGIGSCLFLTYLPLLVPWVFTDSCMFVYTHLIVALRKKKKDCFYFSKKIIVSRSFVGYTPSYHS